MLCPRCGATIRVNTGFCPLCSLPTSQMNGTKPSPSAPRWPAGPNDKANPVGTGLAVVFGGVFVFGFLASLLFPIFTHTRRGDRTALISCESNVRRLGLALTQYAQDSDETYPPIASRDTASLRPYVNPYAKNGAVFTCLADTSQRDSYALNPGLAGKRVSRPVGPAASVIVVYEGRDGTLSPRHDARAVVGLADGHVRAVPATLPPDIRWKP